MNIDKTRALELIRNAILPDRTLNALVDQSLRGTGGSIGPVLRGIGEDAFEVVANPTKVFAAILKSGRR